MVIIENVKPARVEIADVGARRVRHRNRNAYFPDRHTKHGLRARNEQETCRYDKFAEHKIRHAPLRYEASSLRALASRRELPGAPHL